MKKLVKKFFELAGIKVSRINPSRISEKDKFNWLKKFGIKTVIDIGASKGNSAMEFHKLFPEAKIFAFEPLRDCFDLLNKKMSGVSNFRSFNMALSDHSGEEVLFRSSYSGASSMRNMAEFHKRLFPHTAGQKKETVRVDSLDHVLGGETVEDDIFIKIDVQGLEDRVINGGQSTFGRAKLVVCEISYMPLYDGQPLFADIHKIFSELGFYYAGLWGEDFKSPQDGRPLQQDAIFVKKL